MEIQVSYRGQSHAYTLPHDSLVSHLKQIIHENLHVSPRQQKLLCKGKQLQDDAPLPTASEKIMLLGTSAAQISAVSDSLAQQTSKSRARQQALAHAPSLTRTARIQDVSSVAHTFHSISPLTYFPDHERARALLHRLADDSAIKALMKRHSLSVGHLTELDPVGNTSHSGKLLGLNKNAGAEILLRLRTDDMRGFRDYRGIRSTLIHELTHNTHGDHDARFWALFKEYSRQVAEFESGRKMGMEEVYIPEDGKSVDHGVAWVGGGGVLGSANTAVATADSGPTRQEMSAREQRARAAEERSRAGKH